MMIKMAPKFTFAIFAISLSSVKVCSFSNALMFSITFNTKYFQQPC